MHLYLLVIVSYVGDKNETNIKNRLVMVDDNEVLCHLTERFNSFHHHRFGDYPGINAGIETGPATPTRSLVLVL